MRKSIYGICSGIVFEYSLLHRELRNCVNMTGEAFQVTMIYCDTCLVQVCVEDRHDLKLRLVIWDASAGVARHDDDQ
jgi:hypothetical protein